MQDGTDWDLAKWGILAGLVLAVLTIWQKTKPARAWLWWFLRRPWVLTDQVQDHDKRIATLEENEATQDAEIKRVEGVAHRARGRADALSELVKENTELRREKRRIKGDE